MAKMIELTASDGHINVTGRRPTAPMNGFGRMWQKTYRTSLAGTSLTPQDVVTTWKERFLSPCVLSKML